MSFLEVEVEVEVEPMKDGIGAPKKNQNPTSLHPPQVSHPIPNGNNQISPYKTSTSPNLNSFSSKTIISIIKKTNKQTNNNNKEMMFQRDSPLSLSFSDLPISETQEITSDITFDRRPVLTTPVEEFEFFYFNDLDVKTCSADDIFSQGKLHPFKSPTPNNTTTTSKGQVWDSLNINKADFFNPKGRAISHRYSAEYKRLRNDPRPSPLLPPKQVSGGMSGRSRLMPKWFLFLFGSIKMPVVMDMSDIRSRQSRRIPASSVPPADGVGEEGKSRWKFLRALSCRGQGEVGTPLELQVARVRAR